MFGFRIIDAYNYTCYLDYLFRILIYSYENLSNAYDLFRA